MTERETNSPSPSPSPPNTVQVVETIADHLNTTPTELDFRFAEHVNADAFDKLLESNTDKLVVAFTIEGVLVTVANAGTIEVKDFDE